MERKPARSSQEAKMQAKTWFVMAWLILLAYSAICLFTQKDKTCVFVALVLSHICWQAAMLIPTDRKGGEDAG